MTPLNQNAQKLGNNWTNLIALVTAVQHVSVPVNQMILEHVNHSAYKRGDKLTDHIVLVTVVRNVHVNVQTLQPRNNNNVK